MSVKSWVFNENRKSVSDGYHVESYVGAVLSLRERNGSDDSDFYARVWDEESKSVKEVEYATTRFWTYNNGAAVDATPEVLAKVAAWEAVESAEYQLRRTEKFASEPHKGATVEVAHGRKFKVGRRGTVLSEKKVLTFRHKPYANGYTDLQTFKVLVQWGDVAGADMVDVANLKVVQIADATSESLTQSRAALAAAQARFQQLVN